MSYWGNYLLECPDHACNRFLQHAPTAHLGEALFEAASGFTAADARTVLRSLKAARTIYLRAGPGLFVCGAIAGVDKDAGSQLVFIRPRTWIHTTMAEPDQLPLQSASSAECSVATLLLSMGRQSREKSLCAQH